MGGVKRTPADDAFSLCVRERAGWTCEKCGKYYPEGAGRKGLHCSHYIGRGNWSVRLDRDNAESLCYGCHSHHGGTERRAREVLGDGLWEILYERSVDTELGRAYRKTKGKGEVAKHFRAEYERMRASRMDGEIGRIEFENFL